MKNEWSIDIDSELLIQTLSWCFRCLINVHNGPLLVLTIMGNPTGNLLTFNILARPNREDLGVLYISNVSAVESMELPPFAGGSRKIVVSTIATSFKSKRIVVLSSSNSLGLPMEVVLLRFSSVSCLDNKFVTWDEIKESSTW